MIDIKTINAYLRNPNAKLVKQMYREGLGCEYPPDLSRMGYGFKRCVYIDDMHRRCGPNVAARCDNCLMWGIFNVADALDKSNVTDELLASLIPIVLEYKALLTCLMGIEDEL